MRVVRKGLTLLVAGSVTPRSAMRSYNNFVAASLSVTFYLKNGARSVPSAALDERQKRTRIRSG